MTIEEAMQKLREHWGELHLDVWPSGVTAVSDCSSANRAWSNPTGRPAKVYEQQSLAMALNHAVRSEGLGE